MWYIEIRKKIQSSTMEKKGEEEGKEEEKKKTKDGRKRKGEEYMKIRFIKHL